MGSLCCCADTKVAISGESDQAVHAPRPTSADVAHVEHSVILEECTHAQIQVTDSDTEMLEVSASILLEGDIFRRAQSNFTAEFPCRGVCECFQLYRRSS